MGGTRWRSSARRRRSRERPAGARRLSAPVPGGANRAGVARRRVCCAPAKHACGAWKRHGVKGPKQPSGHPSPSPLLLLPPPFPPSPGGGPQAQQRRRCVGKGRREEEEGEGKSGDDGRGACKTWDCLRELPISRAPRSGMAQTQGDLRAVGRAIAFWAGGRILSGRSDSEEGRAPSGRGPSVRPDSGAVGRSGGWW